MMYQPSPNAVDSLVAGVPNQGMNADYSRLDPALAQTNGIFRDAATLLGWSVKKVGDTFREYIGHLKAHDMPIPDYLSRKPDTLSPVHRPDSSVDDVLTVSVVKIQKEGDNQPHIGTTSIGQFTKVPVQSHYSLTDLERILGVPQSLLAKAAWVDNSNESYPQREVYGLLERIGERIFVDLVVLDAVIIQYPDLQNLSESEAMINEEVSTMIDLVYERLREKSQLLDQFGMVVLGDNLMALELDRVDDFRREMDLT
ncbi:MAG TPA: hypothetical protein VJH97_01185 [Candidatus Nanoarchaeia archaeon]|nr:hypothetical protein [Candidatus Nanoarchaeia archaeon]